MLYQSNVLIMSAMQHQSNVHGANVKMSTACVEILCWVDNYHQPYNALPTGNQDIVSKLAQWGLTKSHGWPSPGPWSN